MWSLKKYTRLHHLHLLAFYYLGFPIFLSLVVLFCFVFFFSYGESSPLNSSVSRRFCNFLSSSPAKAWLWLSVCTCWRYQCLYWDEWREIMRMYQQNFRESPNRMASPGGTLLDLIKYGLSKVFLIWMCVHLAARTKPANAQWISVLLFKPFTDVSGGWAIGAS